MGLAYKEKGELTQAYVVFLQAMTSDQNNAYVKLAEEEVNNIQREDKELINVQLNSYAASKQYRAFYFYLLGMVFTLFLLVIGLIIYRKAVVDYRVKNGLSLMKIECWDKALSYFEAAYELDRKNQMETFLQAAQLG